MSNASFELLIVDHEPLIIHELETIAKNNSWSCKVAGSAEEATQLLTQNQFCLVVSELILPGFSGLQLLEWIRTQSPSPEVIIITGKATVPSAVQALKLNAFDYLLKPLENRDKITFCLKRALEKYQLRNRLQSFQEDQGQSDTVSIVGQSPKMRAIFDLIRTVAPSSSNVLILGESGTGKELVARAMHRNGLRRHKPFVVINCVAMPENLLESELFGHVKGAFTGATNDKKGLFEIANGGTVFLDEIGDMPSATQVKLLRVLQEGEIRRVGDAESKHIDVRILTATNRELAQLIEQKKFREDLFYRLNVISITLPPVRERIEDIPLLAYHFLKKYARTTGKAVTQISLDALQAMQSYNWPGNVRELENVIERAVVLVTGDIITAKNLPAKILSQSFYAIPSLDEDLTNLTYKSAKKRALNIFNHSYIMKVLEKASGNITLAAENAGMDRSNFKKIMRKFHIQF